MKHQFFGFKMLTLLLVMKSSNGKHKRKSRSKHAVRDGDEDVRETEGLNKDH